MLGRLFPMADNMKHEQGRVMQKADPKKVRASYNLRENVQKLEFWRP